MTSTAHKTGLALTSAILSLSFLTGCSGEKLAERGLEKALEAGASGDADVDIDTDSGTVKIEGKDGSMTMGNTDIPDSFPDNVPLPDGDYEVASAMELTGDDAMVMVTLLVTGMSVDEILEQLETGMADAGYEETSRFQQSGEEDRFVQLQFSDGTKTVAVNTGQHEDEQVSVSYTVGAADDS